MLTATFCHIKGLGLRSERKLWASGILAWSHFENGHKKIFSPRKTASVLTQLSHSRQAFDAQDLSFFAARLPSAALPRLYPHATGRIAYVDIETTGLEAYSRITTIALYDGKTVRTFVRDRNLEEFPDAVTSAGLITTYNGARFDLPFIRKEFGMDLTGRHVDLMGPLRKYGYMGGMKNCERMLGIRRQVPADMDGLDAVRLWYAHERGDEMALLRLLAYNAQDVLSLELLLVNMYNLSMAGYPLFKPLRLPMQPKISWPDAASTS